MYYGHALSFFHALYQREKRKKNRQAGGACGCPHSAHLPTAMWRVLKVSHRGHARSILQQIFPLTVLAIDAVIIAGRYGNGIIVIIPNKPLAEGTELIN